jgi:hypothetical protein
MHTHGTETDAIAREGYAVVEAGDREQARISFPLPALISISRGVMANAHHLPDTELMRIAGCLRTLADEVMAIIDRRGGGRPAPRLVVDNTRRR